MNYIYVLNKHGKPLMPTVRQSHIRKLIKAKKAVVINGNPFTVRLKYDTPDITQPLYGGMDTGRENIGEGVSLESGECVFLCETEAKNKSIKKKMDERRVHRQERRHNNRARRQRKAIAKNNEIKNGDDATLRNKKSCKSISISYPGMEKSIASKVIRGKEARFNNRAKPEGWLTPSGRQLIQMHVQCLEKTLKILPLTDFTLEYVRFDFQKLENEDINDWQHGPLYGYNSYKDYINDEQSGKCLICGCNHIDEYHHIIERSKGGSDSVKNIAGLCDKCHNGILGVHKNTKTQEYLLYLKTGLRQKYKISLLNSVMPQLIEALKNVCNNYSVNFHITNGFKTYQTRSKYGIDKGHAMDGYAISLTNREIENVSMPDKIYYRRRFKKKSNNNIHTLGQREYYYNSELVAINKHKAEGQTSDSLEEYVNKYISLHGEIETQKHLTELIVKPAKRTYTFHKTKQVPPIRVGDVAKYEKYNKVKGNIKIKVFIADRLNMFEGKICHNNTKKKKLKFCKRIQSGCLQYI